MWWNLVFLVLFCCSFGYLTAQSLPVPITKIITFGKPDDSDWISYTTQTENAVNQNYPAAGYPVSREEVALTRGMLANLPLNCTCPDLRAIHSVSVNGTLRFERADLMTSDMIDHGLAGYLAPFPGYCRSLTYPLLEYYSEIVNKYRNAIGGPNLGTYFYKDYVNFFRPVRALGYTFPLAATLTLTGTPPYINDYTSPIYKAVTVRFDVVKVLLKNNIKSFVVSPDVIHKMVTEDGWTLTGEIQPGPLSTKNELEKIRVKWGATSLERCRDTFDPVTGLYRPINLDRMPIGNKQIVGDCGYFATNTTGLNLVEIFSYSSVFTSPTTTQTLVGYGPVDVTNGGGSNSVGFGTGAIFRFLKL